MQKVRKAHGDKVILDDVTLNFLPGAKIGVVGPNGAGKSTVLKIMAGLEHANNGEAYLQPGASVGILQQEPPLNEEKTVLGNVEEGLGEIKRQLDRYNAIAEQMATDYSDELMEEFGELQEVLDHADAWEIDSWLEQHLASYAGAVLAVTHDRYFLDNVAQWILEIDRGRTYPYEGNYSTYLEKKDERVAVQGRKDAKLQKRLVDELAWVRSGAKARQAKSRARLQRYEEMAAEADKHRKLDFEEIQIPPGPRLGNVVVEVEHLDKGFDGRMLIKDLSFSLPRNGIVGVIGPNGVGKTTLFKTIVGLEQPDSGKVRIGDTVKLSYVDQARGGIDPAKTVWEVVSDRLDYIKVGQVEMPSRAYVAAFGFKGPDQQKPAGVLSGGERNRLNLALTLKQGGNLILLDEPTND